MCVCVRVPRCVWMCVLFASRYAVDVAWVNSVGTGSAITTGAAAPLETLPPVAPGQPPPSPVVVDIGSSYVTLQWGGAFVSGGARAVRWMVQTSSDGATYVMVLVHMQVYECFGGLAVASSLHPSVLACVHLLCVLESSTSNHFRVQVRQRQVCGGTTYLWERFHKQHPAPNPST